MPAQPAFWLKVAVGFGLALLAVIFLPGDASGDTPPASTLLTVGVTVAFLTAVALWLELQLDLGFPTAVIVYTVAWNVLVVVAKFALGPYGFYEVNQNVSLLVGVTLASAVAFAILAFNSAAERSRALGDATLVVSLFWVGLAFLALYQALWVVYVLILTSIWPLKTVTPK